MMGADDGIEVFGQGIAPWCPGSKQIYFPACTSQYHSPAMEIVGDLEHRNRPQKLSLLLGTASRARPLIPCQARYPQQPSFFFKLDLPTRHLFLRALSHLGGEKSG